MHKRPEIFVLLVLFVFQLAGCRGESADFKQIQQQRAGDYSITLLNDTGTVKQHKDHLRIEVRSTSTNEMANVNNLQIQTSMHMPGMGPMFGNLSSIRQISPGRYDFDAYFSMAGQWNFLVTFDPNGRVQFNLNAQ